VIFVRSIETMMILINSKKSLFLQLATCECMLCYHSNQAANVKDFAHDFLLYAFLSSNYVFTLASCECMLYCQSIQVANVL